MDSFSNYLELTPEQLQTYKKDLQNKIDLAKSLDRLHDNEDFKKVFLDHYIDEEPSRLVLLLGEPSFNYSSDKKEKREDIQERMIGIARFAEFTRNVFAISKQASESLETLQEAERNFYSEEKVTVEVGE